MYKGSHETVYHHVPKQVLLLKGSQQLPLEPSRWIVDSQSAIPLWLHFPRHSQVFQAHTIDSSSWKKQFNHSLFTSELWEMEEELSCF